MAGDGVAYVCNNQFDNNTAQNGGAIYAVASGTIYIQTNYVSANTAVAKGGGIYFAGAANVYLRKNEIKGNHAGLTEADCRRAALSRSFRKATVSRRTGRAGWRGGGARVQSAESTFHDVALWRNRAQRDGGGLVVDRPRC